MQPLPAAAEHSLQRTIFWANVIDDAVQHAGRLTGWRHALTADPAYAPTTGQVNALKATSTGVDVWSNQNEISPHDAEEFRTRWELHRTIQQAETQAEYDSVVAAWCIGNPNAWSQAQRDHATRRIEAGVFAVTGEVYDGRPDIYSSQGVPISSFTLGVAMDGDAHYPLSDLLTKTPASARPSVCIWHGAGLLPDEWELLRSL